MEDRKTLELVIDRSRWARGGLNGCPAMLNGQGNMCCLGFLARALGYSKEELRQDGHPLSDPDEVAYLSGRNLFPERMFEEEDTSGREMVRETRLVDGTTWSKVNSDLTCDLMRTNDSREGFREGYTEEDRERDIATLMAKLDVNVRFVDSLPTE